MSKIDVVRAAMVEAMKAKDKARKDSLSMLLSALKNAQIDKREELTEDEENAVVKKEIRQTQETYDLAPADRVDIREEAAARLAVYKEFAPEDMNVEQITEVIKGVLAELGIEKPSALPFTFGIRTFIILPLSLTVGASMPSSANVSLITASIASASIIFGTNSS